MDEADSGDEPLPEAARNRHAGDAGDQDRRKRSQKSAMEFFQLGFDPVTEISAEHGTGVAEPWT
jgi:hypothetical protein